MKKLILTFIFSLFVSTMAWGWGCLTISGSTGVNNPASWNLLDEECDNITANWTSDDHGNGVSEVSPAGQFRFDTNLGAAANGYAARAQNTGAYPDTFTAQIKLNHDEIGTLTAEDHFLLWFCQADERAYISFCSDGLFFYDTDESPNDTEVGSDLVKESGSAEWQIWRILFTFTGVTGVATCDVYLKDSTHDWAKVGTAIPCSKESGAAAGQTFLAQKGDTTNDMVSHVDYIKCATGLYVP